MLSITRLFIPPVCPSFSQPDGKQVLRRLLAQTFSQHVFIRWGWATSLLLLIVVQQTAELHGGGRLADGLQNAAHGPWFALVTWVLWRLNGELPQSWRCGLSRWVSTLLIALCIAVTSELLQLFTQRDASLSDLLLDLCGGAATLALIQRSHERSSQQGTESRQRRRWLIFAGFVFLLSQYPLFEATFIVAYQRAVAPRLLGFDSRLAYLGLRSNSCIAVVSAPAQWRSYEKRKVLRITLAQQRWPGIRLDEPFSDWTGYHLLEIDVFNPSVETLELHVSVRPQSLSGKGTENFYRSVLLPAGAGQVRLDLDRLLPDREHKPWRVHTLVLYSTRRYAGRDLYIGEVRLRRSKPQQYGYLQDDRSECIIGRSGWLAPDSSVQRWLRFG